MNRVTLGDGLAFLATDARDRDAHIFALVGLRRVEGANGGGDFADKLFVGTGDLDLGLVGDGEDGALGDLVVDRVGIAQGEVEDLALEVGLEADALDFEILGEAGGHAGDHAGDDRAHGAIHGPGEAGILDGLHHNGVIDDLDGDHRGEGLGELALGTLGRNRGALDRDFALLGNLNGNFAYA